MNQYVGAISYEKVPVDIIKPPLQPSSHHFPWMKDPAQKHKTTNKIEAKRLRMSLSSEKGLFKLSRDELRSIVEYLPVGEVLMLCLTCKSLHEEIVAILRNMAPFVAQKPWTISKAYATRNQFKLSTPEEVADLCAALEDNTLHKIPPNLSTQFRYDKTAIGLHDYLRLLGAETGETETRRVVKVDWTDDSIKRCMHDGDPDYDHIFEKTEEKVSVTRGFEVKQLDLNSDVLPRIDVFRILSHCPNLETLEMHVTEDGIYRFSKMKRMKKSAVQANLPWDKRKYSNFKLIKVAESATVKDIVTDTGLTYENGKGFYQLIKNESVTDKKEIVIINTCTGVVTTGNDVYSLLGVKKSAKFNLKPDCVADSIVFVQSTSHNRKVPADSYVLHKVEEGDDDDTEDEEVNTDGVTIPVMNQLKSLKITSCYDWDAGMQFIVDILQLCPNLEALFYVYQKEPNDQFLDFLATQCPKLKVLTVEGDDGATPMENGFTDKGILRFLDRLPEMHTLLLYHCCNVSGEVFTKIGKYSKLKALCIERTVMNGDLVDQFDNIYFGGGVLTELETLALEGMYESLPNNFGESLAATAPNLKKLWNHIEKNEADQQINRAKLPKLVHSTISGKVGEELDTRLENKLESVEIENYESNILSVEHIKKANWGNMKKMQLSFPLPDAPDEWLRAIVNSCPRMEVFHLTDHFAPRARNQGLERRRILVEALLQVLADPTLWPNLSILNVSAIIEEDAVRSRKDEPQLQPQILRLRPLLVFSESVERPSSVVEQTEQDFIYNWLALEPIKASNNSNGISRRYVEILGGM